MLQTTTTITTDDGDFNVADLSPELQQLVKFFDKWRQDEVEQTEQLIKTRAAINDIKKSIQIQLHQSPAANSSEA
jgi:hypothetical protein